MHWNVNSTSACGQEVFPAAVVAFVTVAVVLGAMVAFIIEVGLGDVVNVTAVVVFLAVVAFVIVVVVGAMVAFVTIVFVVGVVVAAVVVAVFKLH